MREYLIYTSSTFEEVLHNKEIIDKIAKWAIELAMYNIVFKPRTVIRAHVLSYFVVKWTENQLPPSKKELKYWIINFDGSLQLQGAKEDILVTSSKCENFKYVLQMHFLASNNVVEYETLLHGLWIATALDIR
jgi:hypothetical protein